MAKANKIAEGHYRTDDGAYEIIKVGDGFIVTELQGRRYVAVATVKTLAAGEKEIAKLTKSDEPAEEIVPEVVVEETAEANE